MNRVREKPYIETPDSDDRPDEVVSAEHWELFLKRNQSVVVDLFYGQYKSRLICRTCEKVSNTFDPFLSLRVPIPAYKQTKLEVTYFPRNFAKEGEIKNLEIYLSAHANIAELKKVIKDQLLDEDTDTLIYTMYKGNPKGKV